MSAILDDDKTEEIIAFAPFFPEYKVFAEKAGARLVTVPCTEPDFQIDWQAFENALNENTKAIIVNSPNNPTGVVLSEETIFHLSASLRRAEERFGHPIYLIADEPYRELVYGNVKVPYLTRYYDDTIVCYSFSKSLSIPGERIGYILVSPKMANAKSVYAAVLGAGRALGFVCAPALFQFMIPHCLGKTADISIYDQNRELLYGALTSYGFTCANPDGAFYLFMKTPDPDAYVFCEKAKKYELLLVPSNDFGFPGYVRIAYCVTTEQIKRSLPAFEALAKEYHLI
jgi:aspartate aminotransferase